jgi:hypothetical protein
MTKIRHEGTGRGRPKGRANGKTLELFQLWDQCAAEFRHPAEFLFAVMEGKQKFRVIVAGGEVVEVPAHPDIRMRAAEMLLKYRYPAHHLAANLGLGEPGAGQITLAWESPGEQPDAEARTIDAAAV